MSEKYNFYPFDHKDLVWHEDNKAIIKIKNPCYDFMSQGKYQRYYYCGYIVFKKNALPASWRKGGYQTDAMDILKIHGGLTYGEEQGDYVVFGFDTNHAGDDENLELQKLDYIIKITNQAEAQLKTHAANIKKYRKLKTQEEKATYLDKIRNKAKYNVAPNYLGMVCFCLKDPEKQDKEVSEDE